MNKFLLICIFVFASLSVTGQDLLREATQKYKSTTTYKVDLSISTNNQSENEKHWESADLIVHGDKYILTLGDQLITSDGTDLYTYSPSLKELTIECIDNSSPLQSPRNLFTINQDNYDITNTVKTGAETTFTLGSKIDIANIDNIKAIVTQGSLSEIIITDNGGNIIEIKIHSTNFAEKADESMFKFDKKKYKGVEIIDFR